MTRRCVGAGPEAGFSLVDLLVAAALVGGLAGMAVPLMTQATDAARARAAAGYVAGRLRLARIQAVRAGAATALVFDADDGSFRLCRDGNGNGVRRLDVESGRDPCGPAETVDDRFADVRVGLDPTVPDLDMVAGRQDGIRFGRSAMASCSPAGHCTPGSLYLTSAGGTHFGVRVSGLTGRTRLLRFDRGSNGWVPA
jgi:type II secretory pathway pseudopilin PulG